jgi:type 1 glutamine amidotransferase
MKLILLIILSATLLLMHTSCQDRPDMTSSRILVFSKTEGWRHDSIEPAIEAITTMGRKEGIVVDTSEDAGIFTADNLARFDAVVFLNTSGTIFNDDQRAAFRRYIQNGGGFVGIHGATDTEYEWEWYNRLVGAYFASHPDNPNVRDAVLQIVDSSHPATAHLPVRWEWADEWYNFSDMNESVNVLITIDTDSYEGSAHPGNHPIAWYHQYDGGRAFYTGLGHTIESFSDTLFLQHILGGIQYATGR